MCKISNIAKRTKFYNSGISDVRATARITGKATDMTIRLI